MKRRTMLTKRIIPCLDVKAGRVVKGVSFVNLRDAGDPVEIAKAYDEQGADELTFLDITASHEERGIILDIVRRTAEQVFMPLTVGGGIKSLDDIRNLLLAGSAKVSINTTAVHDPEFIKAPTTRISRRRSHGRTTRNTSIFSSRMRRSLRPTPRARPGRSTPTAAESPW